MNKNHKFSIYRLKIKVNNKGGKNMLIERKAFDDNLNSCLENINSMMESMNLLSYREEVFAHMITYEEAEQIAQEIINCYIKNSDIKPDPMPKLSVNVAPQASGKSSLNRYAAQKLFNNCIIVNSDDLKLFYPNAKDISLSEFSPLYSYITDIGSNLWTSVLLSYALENSYNTVFEGTGKSSRILNTIEPFRDKYRIKIRTIGVSSTTSFISILSRFISQKKSNACPRLVRSSDFLASYNNISLLLNEAESNGYIVEVFARAIDVDALPTRMYSSYDRKGYINAAQALEITRKQNRQLFAKKNIEKLFEVKHYLSTNKSNSTVMAAALDVFYHLILEKNEDVLDVYGF